MAYPSKLIGQTVLVKNRYNCLLICFPCFCYANITLTLGTEGYRNDY